MKIKKHARKAALTALVCMALSGTALAFPTGMEVVSGSVTIADSVYENEKTELTPTGSRIIVNSNSIVNWESFSIASGEDLCFKTYGGAILNRVTGNSPTEIYGYLQQFGTYPMFIVNTNGITVGDGGYITAESIVLSTLAISDESFNSYLESGILNATSENAAPIKLTGKGLWGAARNDELVTAEKMLVLLGGSIDVDDNVTIYLGENGRSSTQNLVAVAADGATLDMSAASTGASPNTVVTDTQTTTDNTLKFHGTVTAGSVMGGGHFMEEDSNTTNVGLTGGTVNLDGASITKAANWMEEEGRVSTTSNLSVTAGSLNDSVLTATADNTISAKGLTVTGTDKVPFSAVGLTGGSVSLEDTNLAANNLALYAGNSYSVIKYSGEYVDEAYGELLTATTANSVTLKNSTISTKYTTCIAGGDLALTDGTKVTATDLLAYATDKMEDTADGVVTGATYKATIDSSSSITAETQDTAGNTWTEPSTEPTEPTEPTDPTDPTEPTEPTEPTDPKDPTDPTEPTDPTPSEPTEPTEPTDPTPSEPTEPTEPTDPTPSEPTEPTDPTPSEPTEPSEPTKPGVPSTPAEAARDSATVAPRQALLDRTLRHEPDGAAFDRAGAAPRVEIVTVETEPTVTIDDERK